jgi:hypothetical protein
MFNSKIYNDKLPLKIQKPLKDFAGNDCLLIQKNHKEFGLSNRALNCHNNVNQYVSSFGGKIISGWILNKNKQLNNAGLWSWTFHSVWLTDENELFDVTDEKHYINSKYVTFTPDSTRKIDFVEGISYNNIVIFDNERLATHYGNCIGAEISAGVVYWISSDMRRVKKMNEHCGQYRLLNEEYKNNQKLLHLNYGISIIDNKIVVTDSANDYVTADIFFDFSLSLAA